MIFTIYYVLVGLAWAGAFRIISTCYACGLETAHDGGPRAPSGLPPLSVVVPARNEEEVLPRCLRSLSEDDYPGVDITVADDGSTDDTPSVVGRFPGIRRVDVAPSERKITGKMNAMEKGAADAKGKWVLFLDADAVVHRGTLQASVLYAERKDCVLLSLSPHQQCMTMWEDLIQSSVFSFFNFRYPYAEVNNPESPAAAANGVFLLVRKDVFERLHGFSWAEGRLAEDMALAEKLKGEGYRIAFLPTRTAVSVRMYRNFSELWAGWSKHFEVFFGKGGLLSLVVPGAYFLVAVLPFIFVPLILLTADIIVPAAVLALLFFLESRLRKLQGYTPGFFILMPLGNLMFFAIQINALLNRYVRKRVTWKGRSYEG